ncbi:zinc finger protein 865-like isoform X2 [Phymastichus coffea]|uniref:zinc finger protein 865-like isoform X2 n=1 Tax=Phymastichus coffea TaxID=108790 RepID=UPI00273B1AA2|nr:zinc finger protein 865-like isoform X2 [Phymastichus coffea]
MESSGAGIGRLDCYEDMFKEITRKLYGDDPDHRSDCMVGGAREVAEHFIDLHAPRLDDSGSRGRMHRTNDFKLDEIVSYLEKVRERAVRLDVRPTRRTQETQTAPAVLLPVAPNFLLQELPSTPPQQLLQPQPQQQASPVASTTATRPPTQQSATNAGGGGGGGNNASGKRYTCLYCPYGTDRRDLYTRHENIHREEKPFHCYVCYKPFSRADHVKKHFLRMHRDHTYELSRIRKSVGASPSLKPLLQPARPAASMQPAPTSPADLVHLQQQQQQQPASSLNPAAIYQATTAISSTLDAATVAAMASSTNVAHSQPVPPAATVQNSQQSRRSQNTACKTQLGKSTAGSSSNKNQERRYTCCYCSWSGVDNWCLKRHLNTHLKPFACALCEYKAARAERLATHVLKVHNRRQCSRCSFLAEDLPQLQVHQLQVHRASNQGASAAAAATIISVPMGSQQQTASTIPQQQSNSEQRQIQSLNGSGGGRAPPGPPVFPASSAAIAPATTVIPPTTILGDRAAMPGSGCWEQEASSCEACFQRANCGAPGEPRRSRKQSTPRKLMTIRSETPDQKIEAAAPISCLRPAVTVKLKCYQCPKSAAARTKAYHNRASLLLHKMWRHKGIRPRRRPRFSVSITLRATVQVAPRT